jgi:hypothetical protein
MADVTVNVTGLQAIVNPTVWNASRLTWGEGTWNVGGSVDQNILQGWGRVNLGVQAEWGDSDTYDTGWGRFTWGSDVLGQVQINIVVNVSGIGSSTALSGTSLTICKRRCITYRSIESTFSVGTVTLSGTADIASTGD